MKTEMVKVEELLKTRGTIIGDVGKRTKENNGVMNKIKGNYVHCYDLS